MFKEYRSFIYSLLLLVVSGLLFYVAQPYLPARLFVTSSTGAGIVVDDYMLQASKKADSAALKREKDSILRLLNEQPSNAVTFMQATDLQKNDRTFKMGALNNDIPEPLPFTSYTGTQHLQAFLNKLLRIEQGSEERVRIAYYGDSMIDGDLIVQDLRMLLQDRFGGKGVGFVPIYSQSESGRETVKASRSGNWDKRDFLKSNASQMGVSGDLFYPADSVATVNYASGYVKHSTKLPRPTLYYGTGNDTAMVHVTANDRQDTTFVKLNGTRTLNTITLSTTDLSKMRLSFTNAQAVPVYGVTFASDTGVIIDNYSKRGNSGLPLVAMNTARLQAFNESLQYDLVILQFGANVLTRNSKNYDWYAQKMVEVAKVLKTSFPNAEILFLGTADRGTKQETTISTDPGVFTLAAAQQYAAWQSQSGFISLLHLMGGTNTMVTWNSHKPKLANDDYTHFSPLGSKEIAARLYEELMSRLAQVEKEQDAR